VAVDASGNVVVTGFSVYSSGIYENYTAKYAAANGALLWEKRYNGGGQAVAVDANGDVVVTGTSDHDYYTAKYAAADGALLWEKSYNGPANRDDRANAVAVDASGNVVVTGLPRIPEASPITTRPSMRRRTARCSGATLQWSRQ